MKSFVRKDGTDEKKIQSAKDDDPGNPTVNFRGERRSNATHQSTSDPESVLYRKAAGKESKLCFGAQVLMENRNGLCAAITVHNPIAEDEPTVALAQVDAHRELHEAKVTTVGGDKAYHQKKFVAACRERDVAPHVACKEQTAVEGLDGRTTRSSGYEVSRRLRKRVEEILGWMKTVGGLRRSRYRGVERTQAWVYLVASSYNLLQLIRRAVKRLVLPVLGVLPLAWYSPLAIWSIPSTTQRNHGVRDQRRVPLKGEAGGPTDSFA